MIASVVLRGGRFDGRFVNVDTGRTRITVEEVVATKVYPAGTYGTPDGAEVVAEVVFFDEYERVDENEFRVVIPGGRA